MVSVERYDRGLLLHGALRDVTLTLADVQRYGADSFGDRDYVRIYGMPPAAWYARGVRLLGRTAVECTRDDLANAIARDVAAVAATAGASGCVVVDPFAGSGNTLFWLLRRLPHARGVGFELDDGVFTLTRQNARSLGLPIDVAHVDYRAGLRGVATRDGELVVVFVAPPWGAALDPARGLDLCGTTPPVIEIVDFVFATFPTARIVCAVQVYENVEPRSLAALEARFDTTRTRMYALNEPGRNHGVVIGTRGWRPA